MPPRFILDEQLRGEVIWWAIQDHNVAVAALPDRYVIDALRVGDANAPPTGTRDPDILLWAERERRVLITIDRRTMPDHLEDHFRAGHHTAGIFFLDLYKPVRDAVVHLEMAVGASEMDDWLDETHDIP